MPYVRQVKPTKHRLHGSKTRSVQREIGCREAMLSTSIKRIGYTSNNHANLTYSTFLHSRAMTQTPGKNDTPFTA